MQWLVIQREVEFANVVRLFGLYNLINANCVMLQAVTSVTEYGWCCVLLRLIDLKVFVSFCYLVNWMVACCMLWWVSDGVIEKRDVNWCAGLCEKCFYWTVELLQNISLMNTLTASLACIIYVYFKNLQFKNQVSNMCYRCNPIVLIVVLNSVVWVHYIKSFIIELMHY